MTKSVLNAESNQRFPYYFDRKLAPNEGYGQALRKTLSYVLIALFSLIWIPVERVVESHHKKTHEAVKIKLNEDVYGRMAQTRNIFEVIDSFQTGLTQNTEYQLAATITDL